MGIPEHANVRHSQTEGARALHILTLVLWTLVLSIGLLGLVLPYERPQPPAPTLESVVFQPLDVEILAEPPPTAEPSQVQATPLRPPQFLEGLQPPGILEPIALFQPTPSIPFQIATVKSPISLETPRPSTQTVASFSHLSMASTLPPPSERPHAASESTAIILTFGEGEGKQPAPEYPRQAERQGQEGDVLVRLRVDEHGKATFVELATACSWPLLNQAALRVVRERWRFREGPPRLYEVSIRFQLNR